MYRLTTIRLLLLCVALALLVSMRGHAQTVTHALPDAPSVAPRPRPGWDFYVANGFMLGAIVADERMSVWGIQRGCAIEGNPAYRSAHGGIDSGRYYAQNLGIAAGVVAVSYIVHRFARGHPEARVITALFAAGVGTPHLVAAARWAQVCS
jgi:hypothetical protein